MNQGTSSFGAPYESTRPLSAHAPGLLGSSSLTSTDNALARAPGWAILGVYSSDRDWAWEKKEGSRETLLRDPWSMFDVTGRVCKRLIIRYVVQCLVLGMV